MSVSVHPVRSGPAPWPTQAMKLSIAAILASLAGLSALSWVVTANRAGGGSMAPGVARLLGVANGMSMAAMSAPLFIGMWVTMMVAMMFPSAAPMVVAHARLSRARRQGPLAVPVFVGGYLLVWTIVGVAVFGLYRGVLVVAPRMTLRTAAVASGVVFAGAGAFQLSRLKSICLSYCRSPLSFLVRWRRGLPGALRMGLEHGAFCLGCCWGLMAVLFVVGLMNLAWMGLIAALIFVEKVAPFGQRMARGTGFALIGVGTAMALVPALFASGLMGG